MNLKKIKVKQSESDMPTEPCGSLPSLYLSIDQVPEIRDWELGKKHIVTIEVEVSSKSEHERDDGTIGGDVSCKILAYECHKKKDIKDMDDREFGEYQSKVMARGSLDD